MSTVVFDGAMRAISSRIWRIGSERPSRSFGRLRETSARSRSFSVTMARFSSAFCACARITPAGKGLATKS
jgi:hypothetical protein